MITGISVTNEKNQTLELSLRNYETQSLAIINIDGLGPVKADISQSNIVTGDGASIGNARVGIRNITIQLKLLPKPSESMEDVRKKLYRFFGVKRNVKLQVTTQTDIVRSLYINGCVESNEIKMFTSSEVANISIICPDPYFRTKSKQKTYFYGEAPKFEFAFPYEPNTDLVEMGEINLTSFNHVDYIGDVSTGAVFEITITGAVSGFTLTNVITYETLSIDDEKLKLLMGTEVGLMVGDVVRLNTNRNNKSIILIRNGNEYNILNCIARKSSWFQLKNGDNVFLYTVNEGERHVRMTVENDILYEGI